MKILKNFIIQINKLIIKIFSSDIMEFSQQSLQSILPIVFLGSMSQVLDIFFDSEILSLINSVSIGLSSIYVNISISTKFSKRFKIESSTLCIASLAFYLVMMYENNTLNNLGSTAIFEGLIYSFISCYLYKKIVKSKFIIRLPESVSNSVQKSFNAIIPTFVIIFVAILWRFSLSWQIRDLLDLIFYPFVKWFDSLFGYVLVLSIVQILWCFGIHGMNTLGGVVGPVMMTLLLENSSLVQSGVSPSDLPYIFVEGFQRMSIGIANLWPLVIYLVISKKEQLKKVGYISFIPAIFGVSEPVIFGAPIAFNKYLAIPWVLSVTVSSFINYILVQALNLNKFYIYVPWSTPTPALAYIASGADIRILILPLVSFLIGMVVYYPFIKKYENTL